MASRTFVRRLEVMMRRWTWFALMIVLAGTLRATSLVPMSFDDQVAEAAAIFRARVTGVAAEWRDSERGRVIFSKVTFDVLDQYKGVSDAVVTLEFLGGEIGEESMVVNGIPKFRIGEELVLFVSGDRKRACPVVGWAQGKLGVERDGNGAGVVKLNPPSQLAAGAARTRRVLRSDDRMALGEFEAMLERRVAQLEAGE
jgi:hypothetical protein